MNPADIAKGYDQVAEHRASGRLIELLLAQGFDVAGVEGVDISERMLSLARNRHPQITFHHADICAWQLPHTYDFISAWDSIWHIPLSEQTQALSTSHRRRPTRSWGRRCITAYWGFLTRWS